MHCSKGQSGLKLALVNSAKNPDAALVMAALMAGPCKLPQPSLVTCCTPKGGSLWEPGLASYQAFKA
eukprot:2260476-Alexandrium_andersonii.AAC.1